MHVFPTVPSPTTTNLMRKGYILFANILSYPIINTKLRFMQNKRLNNINSVKIWRNKAQLRRKSLNLLFIVTLFYPSLFFNY